MKAAAECIDGFEDECILEISEILAHHSRHHGNRHNIKGLNAEVVHSGRIIFDVESMADVEKIAYASRACIAVYSLEAFFKFSSLEDLKKKAERIRFSVNGRFAVRCKREGSHPFSSAEIERIFGNMISGEVDLENPDVEIYVDITGDILLAGYLAAGRMQKRDYRVKVHNQSINACLAYSLVRLCKWNPETETLLDPFCKDGVIPIEAACFASGMPRAFFSYDEKFAEVKECIDKNIKQKKFRIFGFDSFLPNIKSCEINSKLAGVNKMLSFSRYDVDWLDTKFNEGEVDRIVSAVPFPSKHVPEKEVAKIYDTLFYHLKYVVNKEGVVVFAAPTLELLKKHIDGFEIIEERYAGVGKMIYKVIVLKPLI